MHFEEAIRAMTRERVGRSTQHFRFESFDVDEENVGRPVAARELIDADAGHGDFAPRACAVIDLSVPADIEFDRVRGCRIRPRG